MLEFYIGEGTTGSDGTMTKPSGDPILTGEDVESASAAYDSESREPVVQSSEIQRYQGVCRGD